MSISPVIIVRPTSGKVDRWYPVELHTPTERIPLTDRDLISLQLQINAAVASRARELGKEPL